MLIMKSLPNWLREQYDLLPGFGWMDGGCLILASALQRWGQLDDVYIQLWVFRQAPGRFDHFAAGVRTHSGLVLIDSDGVATQEELCLKMEQEEGVKGFVEPLRSYELEQVLRQDEIFYDEERVQALVRRIIATFGPASNYFRTRPDDVYGGPMDLPDTSRERQTDFFGH